MSVLLELVMVLVLVAVPVLYCQCWHIPCTAAEAWQVCAWRRPHKFCRTDHHAVLVLYDGEVVPDIAEDGSAEGRVRLHASFFAPAELSAQRLNMYLMVPRIFESI